MDRRHFICYNSCVLTLMSTIVRCSRAVPLLSLCCFCGMASLHAATIQSSDLYFYVDEEAKEDIINAERMIVAEEQYVLARTLLEHKSVTDVSAVPSLLEKSAEAGFIPARLLLLDVWEGKFKGLEAMPDKARSYAKKMADERLSDTASEGQLAAQLDAMMRLVRYLERDHDDASKKEAFQWLTRASERGSHEARAELARYYMKGVGCQRDPLAAIKLLKQLSIDAPETENVFFYLGYICQSGLGLSKPNYPLAVKYYAQGARYNDARAMNNLGILLERGIGVEKDEQQALRFFRLAASLGDKSSAVNMQRLLQNLGSTEEGGERMSYATRFKNALEHVAEYIPFINE